ncbi:MAG: phage holin family protein [Oscillospiraceae bacterium]|nr:phage holin family protein [Oscillospiraceae bacterium]
MYLTRAGVTAALGFVTYWLGGLDELLAALLALLLLDYITGVISAWLRRGLSSSTGFRGIAKKILLLGVVSLSFVLESMTGGALPVREVTVMFFIANEGLSILENAAACGLPLPNKLKSALAQIRGDSHHTKTDFTGQ